ncbi:nucleoside phosphorylase domain-containing protein [Trichoderma ceciliae]
MTTIAPSRRDGFDIAIICAIDTEYNAVCLIFDEFWDEDGDVYGRAIGDNNTYTTGRIGKHNVVVALLPQMGKINAAAAAANFRSSYSHLELVLLVGICGGVPNPSRGENEILLGDIVISKSVVQYDFGRKYTDKFIRKDTLDDNLSKANKNIRTLLKSFETERGLDLLQTQTARHLIQLQDKAKVKKRRPGVKFKYGYPGTATDRLFKPSYLHKHRSETDNCSVCSSGPDAICDEARHSSCHEIECDEKQLVTRETLKDKQELEKENVQDAQEPMIHLGAIASGDSVMKCGLERDKVSKQEGVIAFEMEGAGVWEEVPCIIVKSVCDYADGHKNKSWQNFAAATAAAAAKALLGRYTKTDRPRLEEVAEQNVSNVMPDVNSQPVNGDSCNSQRPMLEGGPYAMNVQFTKLPARSNVFASSGPYRH